MSAMTVRELKEWLGRCPEDAKVFIQDTLHPNDPASPLENVLIVPDEEGQWVLVSAC